MKRKNKIYNWIEVFKAGKQKDSSGNIREWTGEDLEGIVKNFYDSGKQKFQVPVVIGHPNSESPAWGWVKDVRNNNNTLEVKLNKIVPEFVDWISQNRWPNRSIRLLKNEQPPGGYKLGHVGFLGAAPPAVKGLKTIFADTDANYIDLEYDKKKVKSTTDTEHVGFLGTAPPINGTKAIHTNAMNENESTTTDYSELQIQFEKLNEDLFYEKQQRLKEKYQHWIEKMLDKGKLLPSSTDGLLDFIQCLHYVDSERIVPQFVQSTIELGDTNMIEWFQQFIEKQPRQLHVGKETIPPLEDEKDLIYQHLKEKYNGN
jgi:hypothetical protein